MFVSNESETWELGEAMIWPGCLQERESLDFSWGLQIQCHQSFNNLFFFSPLFICLSLSLSTQVSVRSSNEEIMKEEEEKVTLKCISWWCTKLTKIHHHQQHCYLWLPILLFIHFYCKFLGAVHNSLIGNKQIWKMKSVWWECTWQHEDKTTRAAIAMGNHIGGKAKTERSRRLPGH